MPSEERVTVVVNPRSAGGTTGKHWPALRRKLEAILPGADFHVTLHKGHTTGIVRQALREGATRIVSVGGDGTHMEAVNGFFAGDTRLNPEAVLAILPCGTGSDLARTLKIPRGEAAVSLVQSHNTLLADVGRIRHMGLDGAERTTFFLNTCHIGVGGEVGYQVNGTSKILGGFLAFLWGTLRALTSYRDTPMRVQIDEETFEQKVKDIIIANGAYDGGGMYVAPHARLDSGCFEVYLVGAMSLPDAVRSLPLLYRGALHKRPDIVRYFQAKTIQVESAERVKISPDGEMPGYLPVKVEILPKALRIVSGETHSPDAE